MDGVQLLQGSIFAEPPQKDSLLFTTQSLGVPGTHLINLGRMTKEIQSIEC